MNTQPSKREYVVREPQTPATTPPESVYLEVSHRKLLDIVDAYNLTLPHAAWTYSPPNLRAEVRRLLNPAGVEQQRTLEENLKATGLEGSVIFYQGGRDLRNPDAVTLERSAVRLLLAGLQLTEQGEPLSGVASPDFILARIQAVMAEFGAKRPCSTNAIIAFQLGGLYVLATKARDHGVVVTWG